MQKSQSSTQRNALQRARICEAIARELALEEIARANSRREIWARLVIGLKAFPNNQEGVAQ